MSQQTKELQPWLDAKLQSTEFQKFLGATSSEEAAAALQQRLVNTSAQEIKDAFLEHSGKLMGLPAGAWRAV